MLGALCARPTAFTKPSSFYRRSIRRHLLLRLRSRFSSSYSSSCSLSLPPAAAVWNAILPSLGRFFGPRSELRCPGEGSWNVAWDARPARWLRRPDSAWLLFGVSGFVAPIACEADLDGEAEEAVVQEEENNGNRIEVDPCCDKAAEAATGEEKSADYRVTGFGSVRSGLCIVADCQPFVLLHLRNHDVVYWIGRFA